MHRVVITGLGVVAPNGIGRKAFGNSLRESKSGLSFRPEMAELKFGCQVAGVPPLTEALKKEWFSELELRYLQSTSIMYGAIAGKQAWLDAGLPIPAKDEGPNWDAGCIFGAGMAGVETVVWGSTLVDSGRVKRLGGHSVEQGMSSGISARLGGMLGLGNQVSTNSSACATGTEAIYMAAERIRLGKASIMLAGSCDSQGPYVWGGFDAMRVLHRRHNDDPTAASRPMSASAKGFIPGAGAGALVLESLEHARARGAHILAEYGGGAVGAGGHRQGGSMTAPNATGVKRCLQMALKDANLAPKDVAAISGHLTATMGDPLEIQNWVSVLGKEGTNFPYIHSLKSLIGHCLSAAGSIESVAAVIQLNEGFLHASTNCEDLHPEIEKYIDPNKIPNQTIDLSVPNIVKASFGFGDVNACLVFQQWQEK